MDSSLNGISCLCAFKIIYDNSLTCHLNIFQFQQSWPNATFILRDDAVPKLPVDGFSVVPVLVHGAPRAQIGPISYRDMVLYITITQSRMQDVLQVLLDTGNQVKVK